MYPGTERGTSDVVKLRILRTTMCHGIEGERVTMVDAKN
jgi:hypothetical protein